MEKPIKSGNHKLMLANVDESIGAKFNIDLLLEARNKTLEVILEASKLIVAGMNELEAKSLIHKLQTERGASGHWHPPQVRFGINTLLPFGVPSKAATELQENDIFFIDIGPVFSDHEGDVGRPFFVGHDPVMMKCCQDAETIWYQVREHWLKHKATGHELYAFASQAAKDLGWDLMLKKANGHRVADFPHTARQRGTVEHFQQTPTANRWILEIQIRHPIKPFGAFYEDLLN